MQTEENGALEIGLGVGSVKSTTRSRASRAWITRSMLALAAGGVASLGTSTVHAQNVPFAYTGPGGTTSTPVTGFWNVSSNWVSTPGTIPPSASTTELDFGGSGSTIYNASNNVGITTFDLTAIKLSSTASVTNVISSNTSANTLTFVSNGVNTPQILQNNTGAFNISAGIILNNNLTVGGTGSGALLLSGNISGGSGITFSGTDIITLSGPNAFTGNVTITSGIVIGANGASTNGAAAPAFGANNNVLTVNSGAMVAASGLRSILGGNLTARTLILNGGTYNASYSSSGSEYFYVMNLSGGTVYNPLIGNYIRTSNVSNAGVISTLSSATTSTWGSGNSLGLDLTWASLTLNIAAGTVPNGGPDFVWTGNITQDTGAGSGAKSLTKNGGGYMVLNTTASYTGPTTVNAGTLVLNGSVGQNLSTGTNVSVANGATFAVTGSAPTIGTISNNTSSLTVAGGATLSTADGAIQTLTINSTNSSTNVLTLGDYSSTPALLKMDLGDLITTPGAATIQNSGVTVSVQGLPTGGQQTLIYAQNGLSVNGAATVSPSSVNGYSFSLSEDANHLYLVESAAPPLAYWNGTVNSSWNYYNSGTTNFVNSSGTELGQTPGAATDVFFTNNTVGPGGLSTTLNGNFTIDSLTFTGSGTAATSPVTIAGPGTLTITAAGTGGAGYGAGTGIVINPGSGAHTIGASLVLGSTGGQSWTNNSTNPFNVSGNISGGTLGNGSIGTASVLALSNGTFNFSGNNTYLSSTNLSGGVLNYTGAANSSGNSAFVLGTSANAVVNLNSTGTVAMGLTGGVNTSSVIGAGNSAAVNQSSGTVSMNVFSGSSAYLFMGGASGSYGSYTLTGGTLNTAYTAGIVVGYTGQASFLMTGGTMSMQGKFYIGDGTNAFSAGQGVATFTGGSVSQSYSPIQFGSTGGFGMGGAMNMGTLAGGSAVYASTGTGTSGGVLFNTGTPSLTNAVNLNHGTLSLASTITAVPGGAAAYVDFNGGTLQASGGSTFTLIDASLAGILVSNTGANIDVTSGTKATISGNLIPATGNGIYGQSTGGAFAVGSGGGSGYIGEPLVQVSGGSGTGASAIANISNGVVTAVTLTNPGQNYAVGDVLSFSFSGGGAASSANTFNYTLTANDLESNAGGGLNKTDSGTLILSGTSSYTGTTNILGGTLQVGSGTSGAIPNTTVNVASGAFLGFGRTDTALVFPNTVTGAGGLIQSGAGTTTLTGALSYTGPTNVTAGRLIITSPATLGNTAVNVSAGVFNPQPLSGSYNIGAGSLTVSVKGGASLSMVDGAIGVLGLNGNASGTTLTIGNTSGTSAGNLNFEISQTAADKLVVSGNVLAQSSGAGITITPLSSDASLTPGNYTLITAAGGLNTSAFNISNAGGVVSVNGGLYDLSLTNSTTTSEILTVKQDLTSISTAYWNGALSSTWNTLHGSTAPYTTNWRTTSTSGTDTGYYPSSITNVFFTDSTGGTNLGTTLGANTSINSLSFDGLAAGPVGIGGGFTLTINASTIGGNALGNGINISSGSTTVTISSNVSIGSAQTWTNNGTNPLIVSGSIAGAYPLIQAGTGPLTLSGANTFSGGLNSSGGSLNLNNAAALGTGPFTITGGVTLDNTSGAPITLNTNNAVILSGNVTFNGSYALNMGSGAVNVSSTSQVTVTANTLTFGGGLAGPAGAFSYTNFNTGGAGTLNVNGPVTGISLNATGPGVANFSGLSNYSGATSITGGTVNYIGSASNIGSNSSNGTWTVAGVNGATLNLNSTGNFFIPTSSSSAFSFDVGGAASTSGSVVQSNGTVTFNPFNSGSYAFIGAAAGSYGSYTLTGGTLTYIAGESAGIVVGYDGTGSFLMTGGTYNMSRVLYVGDGSNINSTGQGVATLTGGTINVVAIAGANAALQIGSSNGYGAGGAFNLGTLAGGTGTYTSNVAGSIGGVHLETQHGLTANLNLDHGTMSLAAGIIMTSTLNTNGYVNLDGGILQATGSFPLLDASLSSTPGAGFSFNAVTVYNGGAIFDVTAGNIATIPANLIGASGNGFYGQSTGGVFNVSNGNGGSGYVGAPLVTVTGGSGSGAQAIATVTNGVITSVTLTNPGQNYQAGDNLSFSFTSGGATSPSGGFNYQLTAGDVQANNGGLSKIDSGTLVLSGSNTYTGPTTVTGGTLQLVGSASLPAGTTLTISNSSSVVVSPTATTPITVLQLNGLTLSGTTNAWTGKLDLGNGAAVVHGGVLFTITNQARQGYGGGTWQGSGGITSTSAAGDSTHLTAVGVIPNNDGYGNELYGNSGALGSFENTSPQLNDVLVKYTYYGDTDLSGVIDGSDYSRVDTTYMHENFSNGVATNPISGWFNGDFNYDGVVDGSDYTLMDNAFNNQGAALSAELATPTALVGGGSGISAVPEPSTMLLSGVATLALLGRRRQRNLLRTSR